MLAACQDYDWPGNLRELEQFVKRHLLMGQDGAAPGAPEQDGIVEKNLRQLPGNDISGTEGSPNDGSTSGLKSLLQSVKGETERNAISTALEQTRWNRKAAARLLKVSYRTLLYKIQQYHMSPPDYIPPVGTGLIKNGQIR
ncbi:MAG TPA: helix-turn-helix domain-containing protein, partial [Candidatus Limnocylindrales bacterium]|nr:helix-turn-helix domain-containing protein [Candidatus Limnocylindrales bacterium]